MIKNTTASHFQQLLQKDVTSHLQIWILTSTEVQIHKSGYKFIDIPQANKEVYLELFRVFLALRLVEFQCFGGHFENEYQMFLRSILVNF